VSIWNKRFLHEDDSLIYAFLRSAISRALEIALLYQKSDPQRFTPLVTAIILLGRLFFKAEELKSSIGRLYDLILSYAQETVLQEKKNYLSVFFFSKSMRSA
jgi:hypothetical protein